MEVDRPHVLSSRFGEIRAIISHGRSQLTIRGVKHSNANKNVYWPPLGGVPDPFAEEEVEVEPESAPNTGRGRGPRLCFETSR